MFFTPARWPHFLLLTALAACGSRTGLREAGQGGGDGSGGAASGAGASGAGITSSGPGGGATATGSGASSGASTGVGGGLPSACALVAISPTAAVAETGGYVTVGTRLSYSSDARDRVSVVYGRDPTPTFATVRHTALSPWDDWPSDGAIPGGHDGLLITDGLHLTAPFPGDRLAVLGRLTGVELVAGNPVGSLYNLTSVYGGIGTGRPLALAGGAADALVAFEFPIDLEVVGLATGLVTIGPDGGHFQGPNIVGCGYPRVSGAALWHGGAWWFVSAASQPLGPCDLDLVGPAHVVTVSRLTPAGTLLENVTSWEEPALVHEILATNRSDGAWVAWVQEGATSDVWAVRLDAAGALAAGPYAVTAGAAPAAGGLFAISTLGDELLVAWGTAAGTVGVRLVGDEGELLSQTILPTSGLLYDAVSVLGSPAGDGALVAYTEGGLNGKPAGRLVKLVCAAPVR